MSAISELKDGTMDAHSKKDDRIYGKITVPDGDGAVFTTIPCDDGWKVYVDGEEVEKKANQKGFELAMGPYRTESDPEDIRKPEQAIEIIEPDEFGADENYETSFLSFYADGKLVFDGEDEPMDEDDISRAIGDEALKHFGEFMPSTIHVRNHNYHKDYEILQVNQSFCDLHPDEEDE